MNVKPILELQSASGAKAKQAVIEKYAGNEQFKMFLYYALNPLLTYNLSERTLSKDDGVDTRLVFFNNIFDCCEYLSRLRGLDEATCRQVRVMLRGMSDEEREVCTKLLTKTLRLGVTAKSVNKVIPGLIPEWEVQQAYPIEKYPLTNVNNKFWLTQKLNGVRATFYNGQLIARSGVPFKGLDHIIKEISWVQNAGFVLDGELTLKDKGTLSDNEAFRVATGILNSDDVNKTTICFTIFDAIPVRDFESTDPKVQYEIRRIILNKLADSFADAEYVSVLPVLYVGTDQTKIDELLEKMVREDKEGLIANLNVPYRRTRHKGILKIKKFYTMDLPILRCEKGTGRLEGTLGSFVLEYKGNEVKVGSGFTDEQRAIYWQQRDSIVGMLCEIKYKEISYDKHTGFESLQFPVFLQLRSDKTEESYG